MLQRVVSYRDYLVGDDENSLFIHVTIKILPGRTAEVKDITGKKALLFLKQIVNDLSMVDVAISLEIVDLSANYYKDVL